MADATKNNVTYFDRLDEKFINKECFHSTKDKAMNPLSDVHSFFSVPGLGDNWVVKVH